MPFIRLSDSYIDHPKFLALSDRAFRLWHEGLAYCRKHQTDGIIPRAALRGFRYATEAAAKELTTTVPGEGGPLWQTANAASWTVHNYLAWNLPREEEERRQAESRARTQKWRANSATNAFGDTSRNASRNAFSDTSRDGYVPDRRGKDRILDQETEKDFARARQLLENYREWYRQERHGAVLRLINNSLEFNDALSVVALWDDARLEKLARIVLTTDDDYVSNTDRSFKIFVQKASWADDRLSGVEQAKKAGR